MFRTAADLLTFAVVRIAICVVQAISLDAAHHIAQRLAWLCYRVLKVRRKITDDNLAHAYPELAPVERERIAQRMWENLFLLAIETAHAPRKIHDTNWQQYIRIINLQPLGRQLRSDRPTILVSAHFGNFEIGGNAIGLTGFETHAVARTLDNPYLARFVDRSRSAARQHLIPKKGGYEQIVDVLRRGGTMAFLADQYAGTKGCWVEFFGRPASAHKAIALLALEFEAPIAVCYFRRRGKPLHFDMGVADLLDPRTAPDELTNAKGLTQWFTTRLEEVIRTAPDQYWWLHNRWRDKRKPRKPVAAAS